MSLPGGCERAKSARQDDERGRCSDRRVQRDRGRSETLQVLALEPLANHSPAMYGFWPKRSHGYEVL